MSEKNDIDFLPESFLKKMETLLGSEYDEYIDCFSKKRIFGLRVNTRKISVEKFLSVAPWPLEPIPWIDNGFYYDGELYSPAKHPYYFAGLYYLQEPSAMTPASRLPVSPGEHVLDLCAAPGGKATELGARLAGDGWLVANDLSSSRAKGLLKNLELFGVGNCIVTCEEPSALAKRFGRIFDKILVDAPCSGEGMFRKERKMARAWQEHGPEFFMPIQKNILRSAMQMLKPGGMLLYSTCTFDPGENEEMILSIMREFPELAPVAMSDDERFVSSWTLFRKKTESSDSKSQHPDEADTMTECADSVRHFRRLFPHKLSGEGHFLALLRCESPKENGAECGQNETARRGASLKHTKRTISDKACALKSKGSIPDELKIFLDDIKTEFDTERIGIIQNKVFYMPDAPPSLEGVRVMRAGLLMGELKKNRFEPSQALAMWLDSDTYKNVLSFSCDDDRVIRYLKGETLEVGDMIRNKGKGWYLVCVDSYPLGFGKLTGSTLKNKYLPGWRWMSR